MTRQALLVHGRIAVINAKTRNLVAKIIKIPSNRVEISEWVWFENRFLTLHFIRNILESYSPPANPAPIFGMAMANCQFDNK